MIGYVTAPAPCPAGTTASGPLLLYLQGGGPHAAGASDITNEEFSFFAQDKWRVNPKLTVN